MERISDVRSAEFIEHVRKKVKGFCRKRRAIPEDDLFQSVYLKFLTGKHEKSTVDQVCFDVFRDNFGRVGGTYEKRRSVNSMASIDLLSGDGWHPSDERSWQTKTEINIDAKMALGTIKSKRLRRILIMHAEGSTNAEIGKEIDLSEGRVSQIIDRLDDSNVETSDVTGLLTAVAAAAKLDYSYIMFCRLLQFGRIPFVANGRGRYLKPEIVDALVTLKQKHGKNWKNFMTWNKSKREDPPITQESLRHPQAARDSGTSVKLQVLTDLLKNYTEAKNSLRVFLRQHGSELSIAVMDDVIDTAQVFLNQLYSDLGREVFWETIGKNKEEE